VTDTNLFRLSQPGTFTDPLSEVLRNGARALLAQAVEAEVSSMLSCHADELTDDGRRRLVRHGHLPERTGIGPVAVRCPRVRLAEAAGKKLASPQWPQPVAENHPRYKVHRRNRGCQIASSNRCRLIPSVLKIRR
jgi:hypothetical protein